MAKFLSEAWVSQAREIQDEFKGKSAPASAKARINLTITAVPAEVSDGDVLISMSGDSLKAKLLRAAGRATMTVQTETPPYQYVSIEGPIDFDVPSVDDLALATRYLGPELGRWYAETNPSTESTVVVRIKPERWLSADFGKSLG